jgi:cysteine desulfurase
MFAPEAAERSPGHFSGRHLSRQDFGATCYFDNSAASPMSPAVVEAHAEACRRSWANPSSLHGTGRAAHAAVLEVERLICVEAGSEHARVAFTGGGTEANNLALLGFWSANCKRGDRIVSSRFEHPSILECMEALRQQGADVALAEIGRDGVIDLDSLASLVDERTKLVSVMSANNELGTLQPIAEIGALCKRRGAAFHTDAVQAMGKTLLSMREAQIDLLSLSAHKFHGPRGVGALVVGPRVEIRPVAYGGAAEALLRPGTQNVPGIVALGAALADARARRAEMDGRRRALDDYFRAQLAALPHPFRLNSGTAARIPGVFNLRFDGVDADSLIQHLDYLGIHVSRGSACSAASPKLSHTLTAIGLGETEIWQSLRISLGFYNTEREIDWLFEALPPLLTCLRELPDKTVYVGKLMTAAVCT